MRSTTGFSGHASGGRAGRPRDRRPARARAGRGRTIIRDETGGGGHFAAVTRDRGRVPERARVDLVPGQPRGRGRAVQQSLGRLQAADEPPLSARNRGPAFAPPRTADRLAYPVYRSTTRFRAVKETGMNIGIAGTGRMGTAPPCRLALGNNVRGTGIARRRKPKPRPRRRRIGQPLRRASWLRPDGGDHDPDQRGCHGRRSTSSWDGLLSGFGGGQAVHRHEHRARRQPPGAGAESGGARARCSSVPGSGTVKPAREGSCRVRRRHARGLCPRQASARASLPARRADRRDGLGGEHEAGCEPLAHVFWQALAEAFSLVRLCTSNRRG